MANPFNLPCDPKKPFAIEAGPNNQDTKNEQKNSTNGSILRTCFLSILNLLIDVTNVTPQIEIKPAVKINGIFGVLKLSTVYRENIKVDPPQSSKMEVNIWRSRAFVSMS